MPESVFRAGCASLLSLALFAVSGCQNTGSAPDDKPPSQTAGTAGPIVTPLPGGPEAPPAVLPAPGIAVPPGAEPPPLTLRPPPDEIGKIRVAILLPLSGPNAAAGRALLDGALLAMYRIADADFVLVPFDTRGTPDGAAAAAEAAVAERAQLLIGPLFSAGVSAASPVAARAGINMLALSNDSAVAEPGVYLSGVLPELQVDRVVRYAATRGFRRFAALLPDGPLGNRVRSALQATLGELGLETARVAVFGGSTEEMARAVRAIGDYDRRRAALLAQRRSLEGATDEVSRRTLDRLKTMETFGPVPFDALFVAASGTQLTEIAAQLGNFDVDTKRVRLLGLSSWVADGTGREPALAGGWFAVEPHAAAGDFHRDFKAMYGVEPHPLAAAAFDLTALAAILAAGDKEPRFDRSALTDASGFTGISGLFRFLPSGLPERGLEIREVEPWGSKVVDPAPASFEELVN